MRVNRDNPCEVNDRHRPSIRYNPPNLNLLADLPILSLRNMRKVPAIVKQSGHDPGL